MTSSEAVNGASRKSDCSYVPRPVAIVLRSQRLRYVLRTYRGGMCAALSSLTGIAGFDPIRAPWLAGHAGIIARAGREDGAIRRCGRLRGQDALECGIGGQGLHEVQDLAVVENQPHENVAATGLELDLCQILARGRVRARLQLRPE